MNVRNLGQDLLNKRLENIIIIQSILMFFVS